MPAAEATQAPWGDRWARNLAAAAGQIVLEMVEGPGQPTSSAKAPATTEAVT